VPRSVGGVLDDAGLGDFPDRAPDVPLPAAQFRVRDLPDWRLLVVLPEERHRQREDARRGLDDRAVAVFRRRVRDAGELAPLVVRGAEFERAEQSIHPRPCMGTDGRLRLSQR
jgi:hypothetical protein